MTVTRWEPIANRLAMRELVDRFFDERCHHGCHCGAETHCNHAAQ